MAKTPEKLRQKVETRANGYCEYCLIPSAFAPSVFEMEHIIPVSKDGETTSENLALACRACNRNKFTKTHYFDAVTNENVRLYNPRIDNWNEHFQWNETETEMIGKTPVGRVTIELLQVNRQSNINQRELLRLVGLHPPNDYPK